MADVNVRVRVIPRKWWTWAWVFGSVFVYLCLTVRMPQNWFFDVEAYFADDIEN